MAPAKVPKFKGVDFINFRKSFENLSYARVWSDDMCLRQLFGALEGGAANITDEKEMSEWTYSSLMDALASKYTPRHNQYTLRNKLKDMTQGSKSYQDFMDDISREVEYAHMSDKKDARKRIVESFIDGLSNPHVKQHLMELEPKTKHEALKLAIAKDTLYVACLLYTSPSPRDRQKSRMPSSA